MTSNSTSESSVYTFLTSLIINGAIFLVSFVLFLILRKKYKQIYEPKAFIRSIPEEKRAEPLPTLKLSWIIPLLKTPDQYIIDHSGLDGYFFLRYLRMMIFVFGAGCCITFPILFPVNATGGGGQTGLDSISFSNISGNKTRYYAHVFVGWVFIGFVLWCLTRELLLFKKMRQEYLQRPEVSSQIAQRTILLTAIPRDLLMAAKLREIFGPSVEKVWINSDQRELQDLVAERNKVALILEGAESKLIKQVNKIAIKKGMKDVPANYDTNISTLCVEEHKRPRHRTGKPVIKFLLGEKIDTIEWSRTELARLNPEIAVKQNDHTSYKELTSAFIEFKSLKAAHRAAQITLGEKKQFPFKLERTLAPKPAEIIWSNMGISYPERCLRFATTTGLTMVMIVFWAIPVALFGTISNLVYLTNKVHFLRFILSLRPAIVGVVSGLLPSVMLAIIMALLPLILRLMAKWGGVPTLSKVELVVQNTYFLFQVIQVFLVAALASSATTVVTQIITEPGSVTTLLATNLPKSSNFYISYLLLQGLSIAGGALLQIVSLILFSLLGKIVDDTPRKLWTRWNTIGGTGFGTVFPIYTNLAVIAITYSLISPLILIFATGAFGLLYFAYLYNFLYVYNQSIDTGGMMFPRAIWQSFSGIYILEACMTGLFGIRTAYPQLVLFAMTIPITAVYQILLQWKIEKKLEFLDVTEGGDLEVGDGDHTVTRTPLDEKPLSILRRQAPTNSEGSRANQAIDTVVGKPAAEDAKEPRRGQAAMNNFHHPAVNARDPVIWIPEDSLGVSKKEIRDTEAAGDIKITDRGATLDDKCKLRWNEDPPDYEH